MGEKRERQPKLDKSAVETLIRDGLYKVTYDNQGLQKAGPSVSNPDSVWFNFNILNRNDGPVGYYHIHPTSFGRFHSGNLRMLDNSSFGNYTVGQARDWIELCKAVIGQVPQKERTEAINTVRRG